METAVNKNSDVYYNGTYWNDYPQGLQYMCENFTGDKNKSWDQDFKDRYARQPFNRGLFLNCGNGWVERDFIDKGIVRHAVGFDYSHALLRSAMRDRGNRHIDYFQTDVNRIDFAGGQFDLIVNVAAMHHVQYINRLCRILSKTLQPDGLFVHFDYIGPRRNQYSSWHWMVMQIVNNTLPEAIRKKPFHHPHLPTMLVTDPTEAIHSDLTLKTVGRYFEMVEQHDTGGGIAYEIMTHNPNMQALPPDRLAPHLTRLLDLDRRFCQLKLVPPLFSYFIARPRREFRQNEKTLRAFQQQENRREAVAARRSGVYSLGEYLTLKIQTRPHPFQQYIQYIQSIKHSLQWLVKAIRAVLRRVKRLLQRIISFILRRGM